MINTGTDLVFVVNGTRFIRLASSSSNLQETTETEFNNGDANFKNTCKFQLYKVVKPSVDGKLNTFYSAGTQEPVHEYEAYLIKNIGSNCFLKWKTNDAVFMGKEVATIVDDIDVTLSTMNEIRPYMFVFTRSKVGRFNWSGVEGSLLSGGALPALVTE